MPLFVPATQLTIAEFAAYLAGLPDHYQKAMAVGAIQAHWPSPTDNPDVEVVYRHTRIKGDGPAQVDAEVGNAST